MLVQIRHEKGCDRRYNVYCGDKKLKSGEEYDLPDGAELTFLEYNPLLSRFRFLLFFLNFLAGVLRGRFNEFAQVRRVRHVVRLRVGGVREDEIEIVFSADGWRVEGADAVQTLQDEELPCPEVEKRIRLYKGCVVALSLLALAAVLAVLLLALL